MCYDFNINWLLMDKKNKGGFSHFLCTSPISLSQLVSRFLSLLSGFFFFIPQTSLWCFLSTWSGKIQTRRDSEFSSKKRWWNTVAALRSCGYQRRSPVTATFPLGFVAEVSFTVQRVRLQFYRSLDSAKKNVWRLVNTRHVLVNAGCCPKNAIFISCFGRWLLISETTLAFPKRYIFCYAFLKEQPCQV